MGEGGRIHINFGNQPFFTERHDKHERGDREDNGHRDYSPRENGSNTYNRGWQRHSASDLRSTLLALLGNRDGQSTNQPQTANKTDYSQNQTNTTTTPNSTNTTNTTTLSNTTNTTSPDFSNHQSGQTNNQGYLPNIVNSTLNELVNLAQHNDNFTQFNNQSSQFWNDVQQMSNVTIVEKYVNGNLESQAFSRYGELLDKFNRQGGQLTNFLTTLQPAEREVFQARYLINQTFGADELFVGRGVAIDKSGQFVVRDFLANNGKQLDTPLSTVLGFLGGKLPEGSAASLFANGQLLLNAKTAALLSLSLALYQNIDAKMLLSEVLPEFNPQNLLGKANENGGTRFVENALDNSKLNLDRRNGEHLIAAALINGALIVVDERGKVTSASVNAWTGGEAVIGNPFAAGAMGAMFGAVVGCVVPISETTVGTALGFAASVVIGTSERGLRSLSANLLISDVITNGVQKFLSSAVKSLPPEKIEPRELLKQQLSNHRTLAYLTS
jgi:hypothetical protein